MNTDPEQDDQDFTVIEELTAYLDGELDDDSIAKVEKRLNDDTEYLAEMQSLQQTWDVLDALPQAEPEESFTKTTMELIVGEALKETKTKRRKYWAWLPRTATLLLIPAILFTTAYALTRQAQTEPDRILIRNLSAIQNHYRYPVVMDNEGVEFLTEMKREGLFLETPDFEEEGETPLENAASNDFESEENRKSYISNLDIEQKTALKERLDAFLKLEPMERDKRIKFDRELHEHDDAGQLMGVLNSFTDWLDNDLESSEKASLLDELAQAESVKDKVDAISRIRYEQTREIFGQTGAVGLPGANDVRTIYLWYESVINAKSDKIREHFPNAVSKYEKRGSKKRSPRKIIERRAKTAPIPNLVAYLLRIDRDFLKDTLLDEQEMETLYTILSSQARDVLDQYNFSRRQNLMMQWIESANQSRWQVSSEKLKQFEKQLSDKERDELDKMSVENYRRSLKEKLFRSRFNKGRNSLEQWLDFIDYEEFGNEFGN